MKTLLLTLVTMLSLAACAPLEEETTTQDLIIRDAGHLSDGAACQPCFYYGPNHDSIQGCKPPVGFCGPCPAPTCH